MSSFNFNQERSCYLLWNTYLLSFSFTFKAGTQLLASNTIHTSSVKELNTKQDTLIEDLKRENEQLLCQDEDNKGKIKRLTTQKRVDKKAMRKEMKSLELRHLADMKVRTFPYLSSSFIQALPTLTT